MGCTVRLVSKGLRPASVRRFSCQRACSDSLDRVLYLVPVSVPSFWVCRMSIAIIPAHPPRTPCQIPSPASPEPQLSCRLLSRPRLSSRRTRDPFLRHSPPFRHSHRDIPPLRPDTFHPRCGPISPRTLAVPSRRACRHCIACSPSAVNLHRNIPALSPPAALSRRMRQPLARLAARELPQRQ